jgi:hypothetical protein
MKQAVKHLIAVAEILSVIVHQRDEGFDQLLELARENARASWRVAAQELTVRAESSGGARRIVEDMFPGEYVTERTASGSKRSSIYLPLPRSV